MLRGDDEVQGTLRRGLQLGVLGHAVGLAEHDRGNGMSVHAAFAAHLATQLSVGLLLREHPIQSAAHGKLVLAREVCVAVAQQGQQSKTRGGHVTAEAALASVVAAGNFAVELVQAPVAVGVLVIDKPLQSKMHGRQALARAAGGSRHVQLVSTLPHAEHGLQADSILGIHQP